MRDRQAGLLPGGGRHGGWGGTAGGQPEPKHTGRGGVGPRAAVQLDHRVMMGVRREKGTEKKEHQPVNHTKKSRLS